jgi:hypothetical protein
MISCAVRPASARRRFAPSAGGWSSNDLYKREMADVNADAKTDIVGFGLTGVHESQAHDFLF